MPIPAHLESGLLPTFSNDPTDLDRSPFQASMLEMVEVFGYTEHRRLLLGSLLDYREALANAGFTSGFQFIDGSFVERVEDFADRDPGDIDIFSFLELPQHYIDDQDRWRLEGPTILADVVFGQFEGLHLYAEPVHVANFRRYTYWHGVFSQQRNTLNPKGYIVAYLDLVADRDARNVLGAV